jgi:hypothetical protein
MLRVRRGLWGICAPAYTGSPVTPKLQSVAIRRRITRGFQHAGSVPSDVDDPDGVEEEKTILCSQVEMQLTEVHCGPGAPIRHVFFPTLTRWTPAGPSAGRRGRGRANGSDGLPDRYSFALRSRPVCLSPARYRNSTSRKGPRHATILGLECLRQQAVGRSAQAFVNDPVRETGRS